MTTLAVPITVRDLAEDDLRHLAWAGTPTHLGYVARELERARRGRADYVALCPPSGLPVAIGAVDHGYRLGTGLLWQLVVHPALRSCGLGTLLVGAAEARIAGRGLRRAELSVDVANVRARALYERLGYEATGERPESWDAEDRDGRVVRHETTCTVMQKTLPPHERHRAT